MSDDEPLTQAVIMLEYPCPTHNCKLKLASATNLGRHMMKFYPKVVHHVRIPSFSSSCFHLCPLSAPPPTPTPNSTPASAASLPSVAARPRELIYQDLIKSNKRKTR